MNIRLTASLVFIGTLGYACGPRTRTDASRAFPVAQQQLASAAFDAPRVAPTNPREKTLKSEPSTLSTSFDVSQSATAVSFSLKVVNGTGKSVEVTFLSGQAYDFIVVDSLDREVWRWADGRIFTQSVQNKLLSKGAAITIDEKWSPAKPGKYTAIAVLNSTNFPVKQRVVFERK